MWCKVLPILVLFATQISRLSSVGSSSNDTISFTMKNVTSELRGTHRIIRRFAPRFKLPKPQLPTLPRPALPFPMFSRNPPKGENENRPITRNKKRRRPVKHDRDRPSGVQEDRTLLAAKKAIILKKAIIAKKAYLLAKLKKKAILKKKKKKLKKKATIAYKLNKLSKLKGFSLKGPNVQVTLGKGPKKPTKLTGEESSEAYGVDNTDTDVDSNSSSGSEESGSDEDDDDDDDDLDDDDDDDKPKQQVQGAIIITPEPAPSPQQAQVAQAPVPLQNTMPTIQQQSSQSAVSMMQQLQQQLQQKQQEQLTQQQQLQLLQAQQQKQQQAQNQPAIVITANLSPTATVPPTEVPEDYGSKKGKKKGKKKKKKSTPRPVNLGVKANLLKKFDKLTKKAHNQLSSFIQIDIDFFRSGETGRSALDHLVEPGRFLSRTARISGNSYESLEDYDYVSGIEVPVNFISPWVAPVWKREYPKIVRKESEASKLCNNGHTTSCELKPVYILFKQE